MCMLMGGGAACTQPTYGLGVVAQAVHQKKQNIHRQREGETKEAKETEEEEKRKGEVWKFVNVLNLLKRIP